MSIRRFIDSPAIALIERMVERKTEEDITEYTVTEAILELDKRLVRLEAVVAAPPLGEGM